MMRLALYTGLLFAFFTVSPRVPTSAQETPRGTTLVCVGRGGDGLSLDEWTEDEVASYEAETGNTIEDILAHPQTGTCHDPAGLQVQIGWTPNTHWTCGKDASGAWIGPSWAWDMYLLEGPIPPDPATGSCPLPSSGLGASRSELERAAATAVHLTELEVAGDYARLYAWMHPDSRAEVPQVAMENWYRTVFSSNPPEWMTIDDVKLVEWAWGVTGKVYPMAVEVTYRQQLADGQNVDGAIHLVRDQGVWRWFFGGNRAFIDGLAS
jgi:hypothetical protein